MGRVTVRMPQLGESVVEGTIERWLKVEGDSVVRDEPLVEVVTDKVNAEVASQFEGKLVRIEVAEGQTARVGAVIAQLEVDGRDAAGATEATSGAPSPSPPQEPSPPDAAERLLSPPVRRLAQEHGIDLDSISGSGAGGRVTRQDVLAHIAARRRDSAPAPAGAREELLRLSALRRQIADNMVRSTTSIPHAWGMREVDVSALVRYREDHKEEFKRRHGVSLSYLPFIIQVVCDALKANPLLNSTWREDGILVKHYINLGIAVALPDALIVPVIKNADELGLVELARAVDDLAKRAREKRLRPEDVQGGTFTLNNAGAFGGFVGMSIINHPQAAIMTAHSIVRRPVGRDDQIVLRDMMNVTLSFDHRILDGLQAGRFMTAVQDAMEGWSPTRIRE